jgi:hypothetical protein
MSQNEHDRARDGFREVYERMDRASTEPPDWSSIPKPPANPAPRWRGPLVALTAATAVLFVGLVAFGISRSVTSQTPVGGSQTDIPVLHETSTEPVTSTIGTGPFVCPVTIPPTPGFRPTDGHPVEPVFGVWYGTEQLWTVLKEDGDYVPRKTVLWSTNFRDSGLEPSPQIDVTWRQLDGEGIVLSNKGEATNASTAEDGLFMIAGIDPDEPGCWEVTASYKGATLSYVYEVPDSPPTTTTLPPTADPLFDDESPWILLFDNGLGGVLAVDPNNPVETHVPVEGQTGGDQPYRVSLVAEDLVVGWGKVYASSIATGDSTLLGRATIYVPAMEPDRVWLINWAGGSIGAGESTAWQVDMNGKDLTNPEVFDFDGYPAIGVPGGLALESDEELRLWYPNDGIADVGFGDGESRVLDTHGALLAYCPADPCVEVHVVDLESDQLTIITVPKDVRTRNFGGRTGRFSPDGKKIALTTDQGVLLADTGTGQSITFDVDPSKLLPLYVSWSPEGQQLFASTWSYGTNNTTIARYDLATDALEVATLPYGGTIDFVVIARDDAFAYVNSNR